ncbi:MAG: SufS family cysteine desulfurase [Oscillospiraceae bacterium]|nr:SufS family cysteine desulfurase [Oscillospiraceae bacterium]
MTAAERRAEDERIRKDFPLIAEGDFAYLDNSATSQKPSSVLAAVEDYYRRSNANPLRGLYKLSVDATDRYEAARKAAGDFIGADSGEIIFTRNATESLNLVSYSYAASHLKEGDEILVAISEHHSNMLPWQNAARLTGAVIRYIECDRDGSYNTESFRAQLTNKTKIVAMAQISNVIGRENDIKAFAREAHAAGAVFVCDGAQSAPHIPVDVKDLDVDFFAFSGHKMLAPMGIGVLYGKREILEDMPPFLYGGEMIEYVTLCGATYAEVPHKFEAGTVNDGGAIGLHAAIDYINSIGFEKIEERENYLTALAMNEMKKMPYVHIIGSDDPKEHHGIITFTVDGVHPHDIAAIMDSDGVYVRAGHHCAQPLLKFLRTMSTARASIAFYNNDSDILRFTESLSGLRRKMGYAE